MLSHLLKLSEVQFPQQVNCKNAAAGCSRFALRQFCQAQHLSAAKQRSGQKLTQESKASCIACSNSSEPGGKPGTERSLNIMTHSKYCKSYPSAKQRRRGSWRKKARLCYSKEAECGGKLYAAKLTYFIANIAKATSSLGGVR